MRERQHTTLAEEHLIAKILLQGLPQLERMLVNGCRFVPKIIGADDGRVSGRVASCEPAFLQHRDIGQAMIFGQVIGGCKSMTTAAYNDRIVSLLRLYGFPKLWRLFRETGGTPSSDGTRGQGILQHRHDLSRSIFGSNCGSCPTEAG